MTILGVTASSIYKATGVFDSIATASGTGSSGTITFSSIPSTYQHLQIRAAWTPNTGGDDSQTFTIRFNNDNTANYSDHILRTTGSNLLAGNNLNNAQINCVFQIGNPSNTNYSSIAILDIHDYASTSKTKILRYHTGFAGNTVSSTVAGFGTGMWNNSSTAISNIQISLSSGQFTTATRVALYGIKVA